MRGESAWPCLLFGLAACGRVGFEASETFGGDASTSPSASCWSKWSDGTLSVAAPRRIVELGTGVANPAISSDGLTLYFERDNDLYTSQRSERSATWQAPIMIDALTTDADEGRISTNRDGTFAVFSSNRSGNTDFWTTSRSTSDLAFGEPSQSLVMQLKTAKSELDAELTEDGTRLYYAPYQSGAQDIRMAKRGSDGVFMPTTVFTELQLSSAVSDPAVSPDETVIAFSSGATSAENELFYATRRDRASGFGTPKPIASLNRIDSDDGDIDLSSDGCEIYFKSDRSGVAELYVATVH